MTVLYLGYQLNRAKKRSNKQNCISPLMDALAMDTSQQKMCVATLSQNKPIQPAKRESQPFNSIVLADFEVDNA